jgi:hypothetical protein
MKAEHGTFPLFLYICFRMSSRFAAPVPHMHGCFHQVPVSGDPTASLDAYPLEAPRHTIYGEASGGAGPLTSPALFYLRDTLRLIVDT